MFMFNVSNVYMNFLDTIKLSVYIWKFAYTIYIIGIHNGSLYCAFMEVQEFEKQNEKKYLIHIE